MIKLRSREFSFKEATPLECFQSSSKYKYDDIEPEHNANPSNYHRTTKSQSFLGFDKTSSGKYSS